MQNETRPAATRRAYYATELRYFQAWQRQRAAMRLCYAFAAIALALSFALAFHQYATREALALPANYGAAVIAVIVAKALAVIGMIAEPVGKCPRNPRLARITWRAA